MWISPAYAQAAAGGSESFIVSMLPLVLIFVVFYFLLIRPQQKKMKEHKAMLESAGRGDTVVTGGGIIGTVTKASDSELTVEIAPDVRVRVTRDSLSNILDKKSAPRTDDGEQE